MDWPADKTNNTPLLLFESYKQDDKPKKRLADPITTPRKGPLALSKPVKQPNRRSLQLQKNHISHIPKQKYLNRFPVPDVQRPIEIIESTLGGMSFAELKEQAIIDWSTNKHNPILPTLNPLMKYTPVGHYHGNHGNHKTENHTHQTSGPMDILITYSRHTTPRPLPLTQQWNYPYSNELQIMPTTRQARSQYKRQVATPLRNHEKSVLDVEQTYEDTLSPRQPYSPRQGQLVGGLIRPTIAPHSLHAVAVHKFKPITQHTMIKGRRLGAHTLNK